MEQKQTHSFFKKKKEKSLFYGILIGIIFVIVATLLECYVVSGEISRELIIKLQSESRLIWIIDSVPLWFALFASFVGKHHEKIQEKNVLMEKKIKSHDAASVKLDEDLLKEIATHKETASELKISKQKAETTNKSRMMLFTGMALEFRIPMEGILSISRLLLNEKLKKEIKESVGLIYHSTKSLLTGMDDILDFSAIQAGKIKLEQISIDLTRIIKDVHNLMKDSAGEKKLDLQVIFPEETNLFFIGDSNRIRQILINLVGDTISHTSKGVVTIEMKYEQKKEENHNVVIAVHDIGSGIPEEAQEKMFLDHLQIDPFDEKFARASLGLSISKKLAELMGGMIQLKNEKDIGSTYILSLPMIRTDKKYLGKKIDINKLKRNYKKRALIVDDNIANQKIAAKALQKLGITTESANDGRYALTTAKTTRFDIILMDIDMPKMDGVTATQSIRTLPLAISQVPIIAVTGNVSEEMRQKCKDAGMDGFIAKPFSQEQLVEELDRCFQIPAETN